MFADAGEWRKKPYILLCLEVPYILGRLEGQIFRCLDATNWNTKH